MAKILKEQPNRFMNALSEKVIPQTESDEVLTLLGGFTGYSLGDQESKTRNPNPKTLRHFAEEIAAFFQSSGINMVFERNPGNHHKDTAERSMPETAGFWKNGDERSQYFLRVVPCKIQFFATLINTNKLRMDNFHMLQSLIADKYGNLLTNKE